MKKFSILLTMAALMVSSAVFAGSIDYLSNQSAKYCANTASTARTDGADIVAYNPAGTALMGQGFFIDVSNQTLLKYYNEDVTYTDKVTATTNWSDKYEQSTPTVLLPNVYLVYNAGAVGIGNLAVYGQLGVVAGGGSLKWDGLAGVVATAEAADASVPGNITKIDVDAEGSSVYYAAGAGVSYSFLDNMFSVSAGARYTMPKRSSSLKGDITLGSGAANMTIDSKYEYDAKGITPIFGLDVKPLKELTIGVRYEMETKLEMEYTQKDNTISFPASAVLQAAFTNQLNKDGLKDKQNLPQIVSVGVEYAVTPELTVDFTTNIYFVGDAKYELSSYDAAGTTVSTVDYADYFGTGWEAAIGASYKVMESLKVAASVMYTDQGAKDKLYTSQAVLNTVSSNPVLNSWFFGLGATYTIIPNLDLTVAGSWVHYLPEEADIPTYTSTGTNIGTTSVKYSKEVYNIALGVSYKI